MYKALYVMPMIPSTNVPETSRFFIDLFGFEVELDSPGYAVLCKDDISVHVLEAGENVSEMEFYLSVDNLDGIWESIKDRLGDIKFRAPFDREYGMREIHMIIPHTKTLMFVGQMIVGSA